MQEEVGTHRGRRDSGGGLGVSSYSSIPADAPPPSRRARRKNILQGKRKNNKGEECVTMVMRVRGAGGGKGEDGYMLVGVEGGIQMKKMHHR